MNNGWNKIIQHDALKRFPLDDSCIDVCITSPPYWGLRDYGEQVKSVFGGDTNCKHEWGEQLPEIHKSGLHIGGHLGADKKEGGRASKSGAASGQFCQNCGAWRGQLGLEPHPQLFIDHLVMICREARRVLKKSGSFYLNLGDTYCGSGGAGGDYDEGGLREGQPKWRQPSQWADPKLPARGRSSELTGLKTKKSGWLQPKQLMLIPMRVAIALQDDGWILRNDIIWHKPNPMPSSVKDRLNNTFEHVFHFVKSRKYYYDLDAIREPHKSTNKEIERQYCKEGGKPMIDGYRGHSGGIGFSSDGKNPGDVIQSDYFEQIKNNPYLNDVEKYNAKDALVQALQRGNDFRMKLRGRHKMVHGNSSELSGRQKEVDKYGFVILEASSMGKNPGDFWDICTQPFTSYNPELEHFAVFPEDLIVKPLKASCPSGGVVLDPFCGRGTVGKVAKSLGLNYVLWDIKPEYCELARLYVSGQKRKLIKYQQKINYLET